jgi:hypothetical protein
MKAEPLHMDTKPNKIALTWKLQSISEIQLKLQIFPHMRFGMQKYRLKDSERNPKARLNLLVKKPLNKINQMLSNSLVLTYEFQELLI